jgi:hypothetical protein
MIQLWQRKKEQVFYGLDKLISMLYNTDCRSHSLTVIETREAGAV